jgi:hypothetical protein
MNAHAGKDGLRWVGGVLVHKCGNYNRQKQRTKALGKWLLGERRRRTKGTDFFTSPPRTHGARASQKRFWLGTPRPLALGVVESTYYCQQASW